MLKKLILKIMILPLIAILTPVNLLGKLLIHVSVLINGFILMLLIASLIICIRSGDLRSSVMAVLFGAVCIVIILMTGFVNIIVEDAMGTLLKFMVS